MKLHTNLIVGALACAATMPALAGVSVDDAKKLGSTLTLIGAEKAGNKEKTIPEYTGGLTTPPNGYKKGSGVRPDPFAGEKPRMSIDGKNMSEQADKLTEGTKALLKRYPTFRVDVYPTHRTAAFPKYVTDNTAKCAVSAKTANGGTTMEGCHAGFPFPIPKDGFEAMWNHLVRFNGPAYAINYKAFNVDASGHSTLATEGESIQEYPYWMADTKDRSTYYKIKITFTGPARRAGEAILVVDPLDYAQKGRRAWQYLPGQRRVKPAPQLAHDTPNAGTAGASTYDDAFIFNGSMERYNFKLIGKKEMFIPYNAYRMSYASKADDLIKANHLNPDYVRWELHRVWVVEATLLEGKRHIYSKRTFYLDEDSWAAVASDEYDARGQIYRAGFAFVTPSYELPAPFADLQMHYDLAAGNYTVNGYSAETGGVRYIEPMSEREWSPDAIAGGGVR
jgi:hypothetical protein